MSARLYLQNANADSRCDSTANPKDLVRGVNGGGSDLTLSTTQTSFVALASFDLDAQALNLEDGVAYPVSVQIAGLAPGNLEGRFQLQAIDGGCGLVASSGYSAVFTGPGTYAASLTLAWPTGAVRLRLSVEARSTDGSSASFKVRCGASSYVDAPARTRAEVIVSAVLARVQQMTVAAGYQLDVGTTAIAVRQPGRVNTFPGVFVWSASGDFTAHNFGDGPKAKEVEFRVDVTGYVKGTNAGLDAYSLLDDLIRAVTGDPKALGLPYVVTIYTGSFDVAATEPDTAQLYGEVDVEFVVRYTAARTGV